MINKKKALLFAALPVLAITLLAGGITHASTNDATQASPFTKLAQVIATKFNLTASDVQAVIDETMKAERPNMEQNRPNRPQSLGEAVKDGKLTQAQADLIKAKHEETKATMDSMRDSLKNMTQAEREAAIKTQRDALKQWATENNIPLKYVMFPGGPKNGHNGPRPMNGTNDNTSTSDTAETPDTSSAQ